MDNENKYSFKFVETVITLLGSISEETRDGVFDWANEHDRSGIDTWRDFVVEHSENFEKLTADIDWNDNPPTDYIDAVDIYGGLLTDALPDNPLPTKDDLFRAIESTNEYNMLYREKQELEDKLKKVVGRIIEITSKKGE